MREWVGVGQLCEAPPPTATDPWRLCRFQVQLEPIAATPQAAKLHSKYTGVSQAFLTILREEGIKVHIARAPEGSGRCACCRSAF